VETSPDEVFHWWATRVRILSDTYSAKFRKTPCQANLPSRGMPPGSTSKCSREHLHSFAHFSSKYCAERLTSATSHELATAGPLLIVSNFAQRLVWTLW